MKTRDNWDLIWSFMKASQDVAIYAQNPTHEDFAKFQEAYLKREELFAKLFSKLERCSNDEEK